MKVKYLSGIYIFLIVLISPLILIANTQNYKNFELQANELFLKEQGDSLCSLAVEARVAVVNNEEQIGTSKSKWSLIWNYISESNYNYVELSWNNTDHSDIYNCRQAIVKIGQIKNGIDSILVSKVFEKGVNLSTGFNSILIEIKENRYNVFIGDDSFKSVASIEYTGKLFGKCGLFSSDDVKVSCFVMKKNKDVKRELYTSYSKDNLNRLFSQSVNHIEGYWDYLDRNNDPDWAMVGGRYRLALVKAGENYLLLYMCGAQTNLKNWSEGMIKGILTPTIFKNHYDLVWYDSMFEMIKYEASATIENSIMTLEFPMYKTQIRFYKSK